MNKIKNHEIYVILVLNLLLFSGLYILSTQSVNDEYSSQSDSGLLPAVPAYTSSCEKITYADLTIRFDFAIGFPKSLGEPDQIWVEKHSDRAYFIYTLGKITEKDLEKYTSERRSEANIRDAGGIIINLSRNRRTLSQNMDYLNHVAQGEGVFSTLVDINGNPGVMHSTFQNSLRFYTKTTAYFLVAKKSFDMSILLDIANSIG